MFWCRGKLVLLTWLTPSEVCEERRSSWTGLSAALELSDNDLGPERAKSVWLEEYRGTKRDDVWVAV